MTKNKRYTIGCVIDWINAFMQRRLLSGLHQGAEENDCDLIIFETGRLNADSIYERHRNIVFQMVNNKKLDGLIINTGFLINVADVDQLVKTIEPLKPLPMISLFTKLENIPSIIIDNQIGMTELMHHLINDHKYKHFAFVSGPKENPDAQERLTIFRNSLLKAGIPLDENLIYYGYFIIESGRDAVRYFKQVCDLTQIDVIISANDSMGLGVIEELQSMNISVPGKIALTGFDDMPVSGKLDLPFTTVRMPVLDIGLEAIKRMKQLLKTKKNFSLVKLPSRLIKRSSCGCILFQERSAFNLSSGKQTDLPPCDDEKAISAIIGKLDLNSERKEAVRFLKKSVAELSRLCGELTGNGQFTTFVDKWFDFIAGCMNMSIKINIPKAILNYFNNYIKIHTPSESNKYLVLMNIITDNYEWSELLHGLFISNDSWAMDQIRERLSYTYDYSRQFATLSERLPDIGIRDCYIALYDGLPSFSETAKLVYALDDGEERLNDEFGIQYSVKELLPEEFFSDKRSTLIVASLSQAENYLGFILYKFDENRLDLMEKLASSISITLYDTVVNANLVNMNIELLNEIKRRKDAEKKLKRAMKQLNMQNKELNRLSVLDELTGLHNRRGFMLQCEHKIQYVLSNRIPSSLLFMDMDGLKKINDTYGHSEGDSALIVIAEILESIIRTSDFVARFGGDEFVAFLMDTDRDGYKRFNDRLQKQIGQYNKTSGKQYELSITIGVYHIEQADFKNMPKLKTIIERADQMLYEKKGEKNRP
ncbi:MAG: GGDEF domain-containing protein [Spirochaetales bacterium]|nr:GGDEF domain-containing protein [Spirochaetales bacterium]